MSQSPDQIIDIGIEEKDRVAIAEGAFASVG